MFDKTLTNSPCECLHDICCIVLVQYTYILLFGLINFTFIYCMAAQHTTLSCIARYSHHNIQICFFVYIGQIEVPFPPFYISIHFYYIMYNMQVFNQNTNCNIIFYMICFWIASFTFTYLVASACVCMSSLMMR